MKDADRLLKLKELHNFLSLFDMFKFHADELNKHIIFCSNVFDIDISHFNSRLSESMRRAIFNYGLDSDIPPNTDNNIRDLLSYLKMLRAAIKDIGEDGKWELVSNKLREWHDTWDDIYSHRKV